MIPAGDGKGEARPGAKHSDLWIDKERVEVRVRTVGGLEIEGDLFLFLERARPLWKRMLDHLNENERFFPIRRSDGTAALVSREQVLELSLVGADPSNLECESAPLDSIERVRTHLIDGSVLEGEIQVESHAEQDRLSDFVGGPEPFLHVSSACDTFVHKRCIQSIEPLD